MAALAVWLVVGFLSRRRGTSAGATRWPAPGHTSRLGPAVLGSSSIARPAAAASPARCASVPRYRRHLFVTAVVSVLAASPLIPTLASPSAPRSPDRQLRLVNADVATSDPSAFSVSATVANVGESRQRARVWWVLSAPGAGPEWDRRAYQSPVRVVVLEAGATAPLQWVERLLVPNGQYVFSAWVHTEGPAGFVHTDGFVGRAVRVESRHETILRHAPPRIGLGISTVEVRALGAQPGGLVEIEADLTLDNRGSQLRRAYLRWRLVPIPVARDAPADWWRRTAAFASHPRPVELPAGTSASSKLSERASLPPGVYAVEVLLESVAPDIQGPLDQVVLAAPLIVPPPDGE